MRESINALVKERRVHHRQAPEVTLPRNRPDETKVHAFGLGHQFERHRGRPDLRSNLHKPSHRWPTAT
jgi:hypothetical protein